MRCRTVDLEAPASAEILIEGYLHLDEHVQEGPMGEFAGYVPLEPVMQRPVYHVSAISHRNDAILPVVAAGEPVEENHTAWGIPSAAQILHDLRTAGLAVTTAWMPLQAALHWLVVTVPRDWRRRTGIEESKTLCERIGKTIFATKAGAWLPKVIVLNDDVDPTDTDELVWLSPRAVIRSWATPISIISMQRRCSLTCAKARRCRARRARSSTIACRRTNGARCCRSALPSVTAIRPTSPNGSKHAGPNTASSEADWTITDANGQAASNVFLLTVNPAVTASQSVASEVLVQNVPPVSFIPVAGAGGTGALTYSVSPTLPAGLNFNTVNGAITRARLPE